MIANFSTRFGSRQRD